MNISKKSTEPSRICLEPISQTPQFFILWVTMTESIIIKPPGKTILNFSSSSMIFGSFNTLEMLCLLVLHWKELLKKAVITELI